MQLPEQFPFSTQLRIRVTDLNYGGHVGNDTFLSLLHEARLQYLQHHGYTELSLAGCGIIMADAAIEYKQELLQGHVIQVSVAAGGFDKMGFDLYYLVTLLLPEGNKIAAKAKTGIICYDYARQKKTGVPAEVVEKLGS